ncbi:type III secretion system chaperone [Acerihabitans sp.]|uniref:type III secretion system chaperone n=1 Tax=Acerihabitans sp. TaxID=2811394 RepID=UPI002ED92984
MTFSELLNLFSADGYINIGDAAVSGGCTICFDQDIDITFEYHDNHVYLFSPVMQITEILSDDFFASLMQIHLFGVATSRCWFGYDAGGQRVLLFCLFDLDIIAPESAMKHIETLVDQVQYWRENLSKISRLTKPKLGGFSAPNKLPLRRKT